MDSLQATEKPMSDENGRNNRPDHGDDRGRNSSPRDKDFNEGGPRGRGKRRRKVSYLTINKIDTVDYKDIAILRRFLNDRGKILPSRQTGNTAGQQRMISRAIRKAREMALLPFTVTEMTAERREYAPRRERSYDRPHREHTESSPQQQEAPQAEQNQESQEAAAE